VTYLAKLEDMHVRWSVLPIGETTKFRKVGKFAASIERPKAKSVSASGGSARGQCSVNYSHTYADPCYRLPLCQLLNRPMPLMISIHAESLMFFSSKSWLLELQ